MVNKLNEKRSFAVIIAAIVTTLLIMMGGVVSGLVLAVRNHREPDDGRQYAAHLLMDAAGSLKSSLSSMRLVNEADPAEEIIKTALVHVVRAETALECAGGDWVANRPKEAFLNDVAIVLHSYDPLDAVKKADMLYAYSVKFLASVSNGAPFDYDGELIGGEFEEDMTPPTDEQKAEAESMVSEVLDADDVRYVGAWNGHMEFYIERKGLTGYALVCNGKIIEYSFLRGEPKENVSVERAQEIAQQTAAACGYSDLVVRHSEVMDKSIAVVMCRNIDGALACDDAASVVVYGGDAVAFSAGGCDCDHSGAPKAKVSEREARKAAGANAGEGVLVVRTVNGKERVCYEYRIELDDGVHYVYVCAENGKQMQVK